VSRTGETRTAPDVVGDGGVGSNDTAKWFGLAGMYDCNSIHIQFNFHRSDLNRSIRDRFSCNQSIIQILAIIFHGFNLTQLIDLMIGNIRNDLPKPME